MPHIFLWKRTVRSNGDCSYEKERVRVLATSQNEDLDKAWPCSDKARNTKHREQAHLSWRLYIFRQKKDCSNPSMCAHYSRTGGLIFTNVRFPCHARREVWRPPASLVGWARSSSTSMIPLESCWSPFCRFVLFCVLSPIAPFDSSPSSGCSICRLAGSTNSSRECMGGSTMRWSSSANMNGSVLRGDCSSSRWEVEIHGACPRVSIQCDITGKQPPTFGGPCSGRPSGPRWRRMSVDGRRQMGQVGLWRRHWSRHELQNTWGQWARPATL